MFEYIRNGDVASLEVVDQVAHLGVIALLVGGVAFFHKAEKRPAFIKKMRRRYKGAPDKQWRQNVSCQICKRW